MPVAYQSISSTNFAGTGSEVGNITIPKPTGLAVGDLMIVAITVLGTNGGFANWSYSRTGWLNLAGVETSFTKQAATNSRGGVTVGYKVADADDVAATDFTFTRSGSGAVSTAQIGGSIVRIDGQDPSPIFDLNSGSAASNSPSFATGVDDYQDSLLLIIAGARMTGISNISGYAVVTSNPSWTERVEDLNGLEGRSIATATRAEATSTGAWSYAVTGSSGTADNASFILSIPPVQNATVSPGVLTANATLKEPTISGGATFSPNVLTATATLKEPSINSAVAEVATLKPYVLTDTSIKARGKITAQFENATKRGFVYGTTTQNPGNVAPGSSGYDSFVEESGSFGAVVFELDITSLDNDTDYFIRAFAENTEGFAYGNEIKFKIGDWIPRSKGDDITWTPIAK